MSHPEGDSGRPAASQDTPQAQPAPVLWTHWPLRDRWPRSLGAPLAILGIVAVVHASFRSIPLDAVAFVLLCLSLLQYLFPMRFQADDEGITVHRTLGTKRYAWDRFCDRRDSPEGLVLTIRNGEPGHRRDLLLPVPPGRDDVKEYVRARIQ
jgi:hypothetical protein